MVARIHILVNLARYSGSEVENGRKNPHTCKPGQVFKIRGGILINATGSKSGADIVMLKQAYGLYI